MQTALVWKLEGKVNLTIQGIIQDGYKWKESQHPSPLTPMLCSSKQKHPRQCITEVNIHNM